MFYISKSAVCAVRLLVCVPLVRLVYVKILGRVFDDAVLYWYRIYLEDVWFGLEARSLHHYPFPSAQAHLS